MNGMNLWKVMYYVLFASVITGFASAASTSVNSISTLSSTFCGIVGTVRSIISLFALVMFLAGGVLYAVAHFLPTTGQLKGSMQGWALGMILGGIVGIILVVIAPSVVNMVAGFGNNISAVSC
ncbi:MAG: hypothetical protein ACP5RF_01865 [Candidatus Micrarchaeia archaeon]